LANEGAAFLAASGVIAMHQPFLHPAPEEPAAVFALAA